MDVATIDMPVKDARAAYQEYRRAVADSGSEEDLVLMECYRKLAQGKRIIDVGAVMRTAGLRDDGSPKLAIGRAHWKLCYAGWSLSWPSSNLIFAQTRDAVHTHHWNRKRIVMEAGYPQRPDAHLWNPVKRDWYNNPARNWSGRAVVPSIPPQLRPRYGLKNYHILWEAEWERMPVDPLLLKHIGGSWYTVLAEWDLTPLESAVLRGRLEGAR